MPRLDNPPQDVAHNQKVAREWLDLSLRISPDSMRSKESLGHLRSTEVSWCFANANVFGWVVLHNNILDPQST